MDPVIVAGSGAGRLGEEIADLLGVIPVDCRLDRFPDGELDVAVEPAIAGTDVYIVQALSPPVNERLIELLLLLDACQRESPGRITAVLPYLAYARKDRRTGRGEAVSLNVVARLLDRHHLDRLVVVDPHIEQMEAVFDVPVTVLSAVPALAAAIEPTPAGESVIVAPDAGAVSLAEAFSAELDEQGISVLMKDRRSGAEVSTAGPALAGDGAPAILVDDIVSTGGTLEAAVAAIRSSWSPGSLSIAVVHPVLAAGAIERVLSLEPAQVVVSDTIAHEDLPEAFDVVETAGILTRTIRSLSGLASDTTA